MEWIRITGELKSGVKYDCIPEREFVQLQAELERLQKRNKVIKQEANLWHKRVDEAAKAVEVFEQLQTENKRLKDSHAAIMKEINDNPALHNDTAIGRLYAISEQALKEK